MDITRASTGSDVAKVQSSLDLLSRESSDHTACEEVGMLFCHRFITPSGRYPNCAAPGAFIHE